MEINRIERHKLIWLNISYWGWELTVFIVNRDDPSKKCEFCGETAKAGELWGSGAVGGPREHIYHHMRCWNNKALGR